MAEMENNRALIIGVGGDLPNTVNDANAIADILQDPGRCAYPPANVVRMTEAGKDDAKPVRDNILRSLDTLAASAVPNSTVIVYFSGHGYTVETSSDQNYFLMPLGYNINQLRKTAISGKEFAEKLRAIKAKRLLLLLDCCFAQGIGDTKAPGLTLTQSSIPPEAAELFSQGSGRIIIASSKASEFSLAGEPNSLFTRALIECLCGAGIEESGNGTGDGYVRATDLSNYTAAKVEKWTDGMQHPDLNFFQADNFKVAYYAGGAAKPKAVPPEFAKAVTKEDVQRLNREAIQILTNINTGSGAIASGNNAIAVGQSGVVITGGEVGNVVTGKQIKGDYVKGDKVLGNKIGRQINTGGGAYVGGNAENSSIVGRDQVVNNNYYGNQSEEESATSRLSDDSRKLVDLLNEYFDINDLEDLAFQMSLDWDNLRGETKKAKARALVLHCEKTERLDNLKRIMRLARPNLRSQLS
jgi:hypothetical protein